MTQQLSILLVGLIILTGCTNIAPNVGPATVRDEPAMPIPEPTETATTAAGESAPDTAISDAESTAEMSDEAIEKLVFEGQGDTFLEAINATMRSLGKPDARHFWNGTEEMRPRLQGEVLTYSDHVILFAQLSQDGGSAAVRLEAYSLDDAVALLHQASMPVVEPGGEPDAEVTFVRARTAGEGVWNFDVSIDHPDIGWEDYADGWHVETPDGLILGTRILLHPHVGERPFTRSVRVEVPEGVTEVHIRSHDLVSGYGYETVLVPLDKAGSGEKYEVSK